VQCEPGYSATLYASGLRSPDGLAFAPSGALYVAEEGANRVSRIETDGSGTPILEDVRSPEGIAFDDAGNLYVVEDRRRGRLLKQAPDGQITTLADHLQAPEGVAIGPAWAGEPGSRVYVTESNAQSTRNPFELETGISAIRSSGKVTRVITHSPTISRARIAFWSYAGITTGADGGLYVTNELSRQTISRRFVLIPEVLTYTATLFTDDSIFRIDPLKGTRELVASGLLAPEGLAFSADGDFPLYVAEENVGYSGRLSRVERDGRRTTVCSRFRGIEDVTLDAKGDLYVSEDRGGAVIRIQKTGETDGHLSSDGPLASPTSTGALHQIWTRIAAFARRIAHLLEGRI
jgi:sugar lactone lactonase YvrE